VDSSDEEHSVAFRIFDKNEKKFESCFGDKSEPAGDERIKPLDCLRMVHYSVHPIDV